MIGNVYIGEPPATEKKFILNKLSSVKLEFSTSQMIARNLVLANTSLIYGFVVTDDGQNFIIKNGNARNSPIVRCEFGTPYDITTLDDPISIGTDNVMMSHDGMHGWTCADGLTLTVFDNDQPYTNRFIKYKTKALWQIIPSEYGSFSIYTQPRQMRFSKDGTVFTCISYVNGKEALLVFNLSTPWDVDTATFKSLIPDLVTFFAGSVAPGTSVPQYVLSQDGKTLLYISRTSLWKIDLDSALMLDTMTESNKIDLDIGGVTLGAYDGWYGADLIESKGILYLYTQKTGILQFKLS